MSGVFGIETIDGKVVQEVVRYIGTTKDLCKFIEDAESKIRLEDVGVTLEYGPVLLFHKIAAMIGLQKAIVERCKESGVIPEIIEVMSAYKAFKPLSKPGLLNEKPGFGFDVRVNQK